MQNVTLTRSFCNYLFSDVFNAQACPDVIVEDGIIIVKYGSAIYRELYFNPGEIIITELEIAQLSEICKAPEKFISSKTEADISLPLLKFAAFFITEQYFDNTTPDKHGRLGFANVSKNIQPVLAFPIVDIIASWFFKYFNVPRPEKSITFSCDLDILDLWKHLGTKNAIRYLLGFLKEGRVRGFFYETFRFLRAKVQRDPVNPYLNDDMFYYKKTRIKTDNIAFWLLHYGHPDIDTNNDLKDKAVVRFMQQLKQNNVKFGLHPSYLSLDDPTLLNLQQDKFEAIFGSRTSMARFHYLRCQYPQSLVDLYKAGITSDYSFCFHDSLAFRAGISGRFRYWDVATQKALPVDVFPLGIMDGTLSDYMKLNYENAFSAAKTKIEFSMKYGTGIVLLWHNRSMYRYGTYGNYHHKLFPGIIEWLEKKEFTFE